MLILLLDYLKAHADLGALRILTYITVRAALALGLSFGIALAIGPWIIRRLQALRAGQVIRKSDGADAIDLNSMHGGKAGTPTMGGIIMLLALLLPVALLCRLNNAYVVLLLGMTLGYGALGWWDDWLKIVEKNHRGVTPRRKIAVQVGLALILGLTLWLGDWDVTYAPNYQPDAGAMTEPFFTGYDYIAVPFFKLFYPKLAVFYVLWVVVVLVGSSNAVNLTDGLDGLAIGVSIANIMAFLAMTYLVTRADFARYLLVPHIAGGGEIVVFLAALLGASMGFLWFNAHPASVFMGDTGSMMVGGALGTTALLIKQELLLIVVGGIFVIEALSVILQVGMFKLTGTRVLRMSPLHHHYERTGMHESRIIIRFWIISWLLAMAGLAMLKLR